MIIDNPVKRLKDALDVLKIGDAELQQKRQGTYSLRYVLHNVYDEEGKGNTFSEILYYWYLLGKLNQEAKERVKQLGNTAEFHLKPFVTLETFLSTSNFDIAFNEFIYIYSGETSVALDFCADLIMRDNGGKEVDLIKVNNIKEDIEELLNKIPSYDIDEEVKSFIFKQLSSIQEVLHHYNLHGINGIKGVIEKVMGSIAINQITAKPINKTDLKDIFDILARLELLFSLYNSVTPMITEIGKKFLGS
jgi:hypothetical protein